MGKKTPDAPDYSQAAEMSGQSAKEVTAQQTFANRPDQTTPWGTSTWESQKKWDPATNQFVTTWDQNLEIPKVQQNTLDQQNKLALDKTKTARGLWGRLDDQYQDPIDWSGLSEWGTLPGSADVTRQRAEDALYDRMTSRLDPRFEQSKEAFDAKMANQGIVAGSEGYDRAYQNFSMGQNDAYQTAMNEAIMGGGREAQRDFDMGMDLWGAQNTQRQAEAAELMRQRGYGLNEIQAILGGTQVGVPNMPSFSMASKSDPIDYLGAAGSQYNASMDAASASNAAAQGAMQGIGSLASMAMFMSDRRLKSNIRPVGSTPGGQTVYEYTIFGMRDYGVMADESPADAVVEHPSGYLMVDYSRIV